MDRKITYRHVWLSQLNDIEFASVLRLTYADDSMLHTYATEDRSKPNRRVRCILAYCGRTIVGWSAIFKRDRTYGHNTRRPVVMMYVSPAYRGLGIARELFDRSYRSARRIYKHRSIGVYYHSFANYAFYRNIVGRKSVYWAETNKTKVIDPTFKPQFISERCSSQWRKSQHYAEYRLA